MSRKKLIIMLVQLIKLYLNPNAKTKTIYPLSRKSSIISCSKSCWMGQSSKILTLNHNNKSSKTIKCSKNLHYLNYRNNLLTKLNCHNNLFHKLNRKSESQSNLQVVIMTMNKKNLGVVFKTLWYRQTRSFQQGLLAYIIRKFFSTTLKTSSIHLLLWRN